LQFARLPRWPGQGLAAIGFIFVRNRAGPFLLLAGVIPTLFRSVLITASLKPVSSALAAALLLGLLVALPAQAQRKDRRTAAANADGSLPPAPPARAARLQPLFGGLTPAQATLMLGEARLQAIAASFANKDEASAFFTTKGFDYLRENQPDTATYRFNLAWLLNPQNAEVYRGLGVIASAQPTPDGAIALLAKGMALAPSSTLLMGDLGTTYLLRYNQTKKKKDLTAGVELLQRATTADPTSANSWQQLARGFYYQEKYTEAWNAVHKGQNASVSSLDFDLISDLLAKLPDPQGTFK
jgi:predicted Zn-dependent protease